MKSQHRIPETAALALLRALGCPLEPGRVRPDRLHSNHFPLRTPKLTLAVDVKPVGAAVKAGAGAATQESKVKKGLSD